MITDGIVSFKIYDTPENFTFEIVNWRSSLLPYYFAVIRFARVKNVNKI